MLIAAAVTMFLIKNEESDTPKELENEIQQVHF
jgi:maltose/moltooligosaccharide transporter